MTQVNKHYAALTSTLVSRVNSTFIYNIVIINMNCWATRNLPFYFVYYHNLKLNKYFIKTILYGRQHNSNHTFQDYTNLQSGRSMSSVYICCCLEVILRSADTKFPYKLSLHSTAQSFHGSTLFTRWSSHHT